MRGVAGAAPLPLRESPATQSGTTCISRLCADAVGTEAFSIPTRGGIPYGDPYSLLRQDPLGGILAANRLTNYRIAQLEKKVEQHNSVVERTYRLEGAVREIQHEIRDLKD